MNLRMSWGRDYCTHPFLAEEVVRTTRGPSEQKGCADGRRLRSWASRRWQRPCLPWLGGLASSASMLISDFFFNNYRVLILEKQKTTLCSLASRGACDEGHYTCANLSMSHLSL